MPYNDFNRGYLLTLDTELPGDGDMEPNGNMPQTRKADEPRRFNPFLGFDQTKYPKGIIRIREEFSRWAKQNNLENLDMEHWETHPRMVQIDYEGDAVVNLRNRPFSRALNVTYEDNPARDVLATTHAMVENVLLGGPRLAPQCMELTHPEGRGICSKDAPDPVGCRNLIHCDNEPDHFLVCDVCDATSAGVLVNSNPITTEEIISMRAYLCNTCAVGASTNISFCGVLPNDGTSKIWGHIPNHGITMSVGPMKAHYQAMTLPATGCACAAKLLGLRLCQYHRLRGAEQVIKQSALMKEWRARTFGRPVCPSCLFGRGPTGAYNSADNEGFQNTNEGTTAWMCLACNDWVVNQRNDDNNNPQLVPGHLRNHDVNVLFRSEMPRSMSEEGEPEAEW
jgi:hypothetical protein